ncbi:MAG: DUF1176 domain-containing protein [Pseudanabaenaceae cyanobacterium bins.39]|nr:DUF1176 domain-containing protein [Pseudanabaenaceae cyanobacterium bins.39]
MLHTKIGLMSLLVSMVMLGCSNQETTPPTATVDKAASASTVTPIKESPKPNQESPKPSPSTSKPISLGDIADLSDQTMCNNGKVNYAYGETANYKVYICADASAPDRPRYYISRNKDGSGGLNIEAKNYNPQKTGAIEFKNDSYLYILESPTTQNPEPALRVIFPNGKASEEQLLQYLGRGNIASTPKDSGTSSTDPLQYVLQNREKLGLCKDNFQENTGGMGSRAFKLNDRQYLVQIQCFLAAYQGSFEFVLWSDEGSQPRVVNLEFDRFEETSTGAKPKRVTDRTLVGLPRVNVRSQTITNFTKFRGVGDCGSSALYKLEGDRVVLQEFRAKYTCDGEYVQDFPIVFP